MIGPDERFGDWSGWKVCWLVMMEGLVVGQEGRLMVSHDGRFGDWSGEEV